MPDPVEIVSRLDAISSTRDLQGKRVVVTAGPTREPIDPARYITNRSSGRMGYAIATAAARRGAEVILVSGPTHLRAPAGVTLRTVTTAAEMYDEVMAKVAGADVFVAAAAVADYEPVSFSPSKMKKSGDDLKLELRETRDILASVGHLDENRPFVVGFAAETDRVAENARSKLERKRADMIVANDVSRADIGFDSDRNEVTVLTADGEHAIPLGSKERVADALWDLVIERLGSSPARVAG